MICTLKKVYTLTSSQNQPAADLSETSKSSHEGVQILKGQCGSRTLSLWLSW